MHDTDYLGPAPAGTTWVLAHTTHLHSTDEPYTYIESFADVRTAVHELAERVRPRWTRQRSRITAEEITAEKGAKLVQQYQCSPILGELYKPITPRPKDTPPA